MDGHDGGVHGSVIDFRHLGMKTHRGLEDQPAFVGHQEFGRGLETLGFALAPGDEDVVATARANCMEVMRVPGLVRATCCRGIWPSRANCTRPVKPVSRKKKELRRSTCQRP